MLPPFIIEQIRQREEQKHREEQPVLELPLDDFGSRGGLGSGRRRHERPGSEGSEGEPPAAPEVERGVTIIQF
jgi:hypothetical protein